MSGIKSDLFTFFTRSPSAKKDGEDSVLQDVNNYINEKIRKLIDTYFPAFSLDDKTKYISIAQTDMQNKFAEFLQKTSEEEKEILLRKTLSKVISNDLDPKEDRWTVPLEQHPTRLTDAQRRLYDLDADTLWLGKTIAQEQTERALNKLSPGS